MYSAKAQGKSNYKFYQPSIMYQPQIDIVTGTIIGMEALLRWQHPMKGNIAENSRDLIKIIDIEYPRTRSKRVSRESCV
jgi:EAL domain-containing protein (putative c-di-GMP-specific phosphodiesterase class I)